MKKISLGAKTITIAVIAIIVIFVIAIFAFNSGDDKAIKNTFETYEKAIKGDESAQKELDIDSVKITDSIKQSVNIQGDPEKMESFGKKVIDEFTIQVDSIEKVDKKDNTYTVTYSMDQYNLTSVSNVSSIVNKVLTEEEIVIYNSGMNGGYENYDEVYAKVQDAVTEKITKQEPKNKKYTVEVSVNSDDKVVINEPNFTDVLIDQLFGTN